jgi:hypothetical protein
VKQIDDRIAAVGLGVIAGRQIDVDGTVSGVAEEVGFEELAVDGDVLDGAVGRVRLGRRPGCEGDAKGENEKQKAARGRQAELLGGDSGAR